MKDIIFTDFFDTIMFRHIHPFQVRNRWCHIVAKRYGVDESDLVKASRIVRQDKYTNLYSDIYKTMKDLQQKVSLEDFIHVSLDIETAVEIGCQYLNKRYWKCLKKWKEQGKKIIIVSDFHLPKESFVDFLLAKNIDPEFFDAIYISSDFGLSKAKGNLYDYVLNDFGCTASDVCMIGDNAIADGKRANACGIESKIIPNYLPKLKGQIARRLHRDYSHTAFKKIRREAYNNPFSEYSLLFFLFTKALYEKLSSKKEKSVTFLAREGFFLKELFDDYQSLLLENNEKIDTKYLKCSRRAAKSLSKDYLLGLVMKDISISDYLMSLGYTQKEIFEISKKNYDLHSEEIEKLTTQRHKDNVVAAKKYMSQFVVDGHVNIVDIGWCGTMQNAVSSILNIPAYGYYLGLNNSPYDLSNREGLLFDYNKEKGISSNYADILRTNIQLYEELAAAPHGSALGYRLDEEGNAYVTEDWAENEKLMYENVISKKQKELRLICKAISAWCYEQDFNKMLKICAKTVLRSALIADEKRLNFLESLDKGFIDNCGKQSKGLKYDAKSVKIGLDILYAPERYTRYFAKVQRALKARASVLQRMYLPIAWGGVIYIWCVSNLNIIKK